VCRSATLTERPTPGTNPSTSCRGNGSGETLKIRLIQERTQTIALHRKARDGLCSQAGWRQVTNIWRTGDDFAVLLGRDTLIYAGLLHGARGSISATANVVPALVVEIYQAFVEGDRARALGAQNRLAPLRRAFGLGTFPVVVKEALELVGISAGPARSPVGPISPENREKLRQILQGLGLEPGRCRDDL
jgi:hypothetical protein